jgi:hypothetical protein
MCPVDFSENSCDFCENVNATVKIFVATRNTIERDVRLSTILVSHRNTFGRHTNKLNRKQNLLNAISTFREDEQAYLNPTHASWNGTRLLKHS